MSERGKPATAEDAEAVLRLRPMIWFGMGVAALCLVLAMSSFQLGLSNDTPVLTFGAAPFFVLIAAAWLVGVRRLRARVAAARQLLGD